MRRILNWVRPVIRQRLNPQAILVNRNTVEPRALRQKRGMEADITGVFDDQALPRLDQQPRQQCQYLLHTACDQHLLWLAAHRPRAPQPGGNCLARLDWPQKRIPPPSARSVFAGIDAIFRLPVRRVLPADDAPPACPGERLRRADAGAKIITRICGAASSQQGNLRDTPRPGRQRHRSCYRRLECRTITHLPAIGVGAYTTGRCRLICAIYSKATILEHWRDEGA